MRKKDIKVEEQIESKEKVVENKEEIIEKISEEQMDKIKSEIKNNKKEKKINGKNKKYRKSILRNIVTLIIICIYFAFIQLSINTIPKTEYILDLKVFSIFIAIIAVAIFENAYKKDENYLAIHGIEMIVLGLETLIILQIYVSQSEYFSKTIYIIGGIMIGYYLLKSLIIYIRGKLYNN